MTAALTIRLRQQFVARKWLPMGNALARGGIPAKDARYTVCNTRLRPFPAYRACRGQN
jgi:hypothetical protein